MLLNCVFNFSENKTFNLFREIIKIKGTCFNNFKYVY